jgi:hypothetical protein
MRVRNGGIGKPTKLGKERLLQCYFFHHETCSKSLVVDNALPFI